MGIIGEDLDIGGALLVSESEPATTWPAKMKGSKRAFLCPDHIITGERWPFCYVYRLPESL